MGALLMQANCNSLKGALFDDFIADAEERRAFKHALKMNAMVEVRRRSVDTSSSLFDAIPSDPSRGMCHVHLRDSFGHEFLVSAYFTSIAGLDGEPIYVVGLVEAQEREAKPGPIDAVADLMSHQSSNQSSSCRSNISISIEHDIVGSTFCVSLPDFEVLECTHNASGSYGVEDVAGQDFSKLFLDQAQIQTWVVDALERCRERPEGYVDEFGPARFMLTIVQKNRKRKMIIDVNMVVAINLRQDVLDGCNLDKDISEEDSSDQVVDGARLFEGQFQVS
eukprot:TRINITY_DN72505_c0_g1_i1.p1 TRINITY_DN72505_c0_g1~~TRINITY_DN72505_c0_g1_i1.p1  ORF type:complete len:279 (+),score=40.01 TRINITY_DN72505_c0_g1_i1:828-1664(+)